MKKWFHIFYIFTLACSLSAADDFHMAADFDENEKIYIVYVPNESIVELIVTLSKYENVGVVVESQEAIPSVRSTLIGQSVNINNIHFSIFPGTDLWIRDSAPAILKNNNGHLKAVNFKAKVKMFEENDRKIAQGLNLPIINSNILSVGGARESNGEGTTILAESFFHATTPDFNKKSVEKNLKKNLGIKEIIWLKSGLIEDELFKDGPIHDSIYPVGCGGHIDEFCRFVSSNTVLLAEVDHADLNKHPLHKVNRQRLEENYQILKNFDNQKLNVIRIPTADFLFRETTNPGDGKTYKVALTASYLNFVIGNNVVIAARYFEEGMPLSVKDKDERVRLVLQDQFPDKEVIQINPQHINARGGGYHCVTFNLPAKKKFIRKPKVS